MNRSRRNSRISVAVLHLAGRRCSVNNHADAAVALDETAFHASNTVDPFLTQLAQQLVLTHQLPLQVLMVELAVFNHGERLSINQFTEWRNIETQPVQDVF